VLSADLVGEEPISELRVVLVGVEDRVRQPRLVELSIGERVLQPSIERRASQTEYPTRHRDGDPVDSELAHERVHHPFGMLA
jgi:hypothetical protein